MKERKEETNSQLMGEMRKSAHEFGFVQSVVKAIKRKFSELSDAEKLTLRAQSMEGHTPGRLISMSDGSKYRVARSGAWICAASPDRHHEWAHRFHYSKSSQRRLGRA